MELGEAGEVQRAGHAVGLFFVRAEFFAEEGEDLVGDGLFDLQAHEGSEAAAQQFPFQGFDEVVGFVFVHF